MRRWRFPQTETVVKAVPKACARGGRATDHKLGAPGWRSTSGSAESCRLRIEPAIDTARASLLDEGCVGHEDNLITDDDLRWKGRALTLDTRGTMPYSCFEISSFVLSIYAQHAASGELSVVNIEDGVGQRLLAGGESEELGEERVDALRREYTRGRPYR